MACGQSLYAVRSGMAECTPNLRAAYDAAETTPRSLRWPPTTTGLPFSDGSKSSSTDTKKASISTWKITRSISAIVEQEPAAGRFPLSLGGGPRLSDNLRATKQSCTKDFRPGADLLVGFENPQLIVDSQSLVDRSQQVTDFPQIPFRHGHDRWAGTTKADAE